MSEQPQHYQQPTQQETPQQDRKEEVITLDRVPWSQLAQEFAETWGRADPKDPQPESMETIGMNGSGKTLFVCKAVQERMLVRHTPTYILQSKPDDQTVVKLGW